MDSPPLLTVADVIVRSSIAGAIELVDVPGGFSPRRLPALALLQRADDNIRVYSGVATGVRLRLMTDARRIELDLSVVTPVPKPDAVAGPPVVVTELDGVEAVRTPVPRYSRRWVGADGRMVDEPPVATTIVLDLPAAGAVRARSVDVWLPHDAEVTIEEVRADGEVRASGTSGLPRWVHHGSSISHALDAPGPHGPWPQRVARDLELDLVNLSIAGQAVLDQSVARAIAALPADVITLKLGINIINCDGFSTRTLGPAVHGFLDTVRDGHPATPIVVITAVACPIHEDTPGPTIAGSEDRAIAMPRERHPRDGRLTLRDVRRIIAQVVSDRAATDERLALMDGLTLFGVDDAHHLYDDLHPDSAGNELIGSRFVATARDAGSPLGRAVAASRRV